MSRRLRGWLSQTQRLVLRAMRSLTLISMPSGWLMLEVSCRVTMLVS